MRSAKAISVSYTTTDGTAFADEDYKPVHGTLHWPAGMRAHLVAPVLRSWHVSHQMSNHMCIAKIVQLYFACALTT